MAFNREAYKATPLENLEEQTKEAKEKGIKTFDRAEMLEIKKDGTKNRLRIYPSKPGDKSFMYLKMITFLKMELSDKDNNPIKNDDGTRKLGQRPVFDAVVHGQWDEGMAPRDIIRMYRDAVFAKAKALSKEDNAKFLLPLQGSPFNSKVKGEFNGIKPQSSWICYGVLNGEFGRIELKPTVREKLNTLAREQDSEEGAFNPDPYTDPDTGRMVFITFYNEKDGADKYAVSIDINKASPIPDDLGEKWEGQTSLQQLYTNCYRLRDFQLALDGLKMFDEESEAHLKKLGFKEGYNIFADDSFMNAVEDLYDYWEQKDKQAKENAAEDVKSDSTDNSKEPIQKKSEEPVNKPPFQADSSTKADKYDQMDYDQLATEAKRLGIRVMKAFTEEVLREMIREEIEACNASNQTIVNAAEEVTDDYIKQELNKPVEEEKPVAATRSSRLDKYKDNK